ncbi:hypothetical protein PTKIN_Ptkin06aG0144800 [Pterospermum kingtungense]
MGTERSEFGVRKFLVISVKTCYRSIWNHPFLIGLVGFLILLYRSFPLLFSVLVTASPVLICTGVLLGTLLCFGSPNIPELDEKEEEENVNHEVSPLKTWASEDDTVVERDVGDDGFIIERLVEKRWDIVENADKKVSSVDYEVSEVEEDDGSVQYKPLVNEDLGSRDIHCENGVIDGVVGVLNDSLVESKREFQEKMLGSEGLLSMGEAKEDRHLLADEVCDRNLEVEDGKFTADFGDVDELDASLVSSSKRTGDDDDNESLDSDGSDGAESSSPDASMAEIIPMLDELHPLLSSETPQPAQMSHYISDVASEKSNDSSNDESVDSDELENQGEDEDEGEGEGAKGDKEDESKSAIKWTEDDQKNLMDLGTLELERNQRLETLIARRRSRKSMSSMAEKNLIDLDSADIPLNITPISAARRNPFDLPYDSYDDLGLPPIPGSAPSNLQPRRNPFDLPYGSSEEKPDLKGDSLEEEFSGFNQRETVSQREAFFRRHESFNVGPSSLSVPRQELKWKPYFVPENFVTEGANTSSFQRQSSEVSESKLSSVPDTESVSSVVDEEDNMPNEQDVSQETELILNEDHASVHEEQDSLSSGDVESVDVDQAENRDVQHDVVEITLGDGESILEMESNMFEAGATTHVELDASEIHPRIEPLEEGYSSRSSFSSLSEIEEKRSHVREDGSAGSEPRDREIKQSGISTQPSFEESELHFTSRVEDDNQHREPVYDTSPSSVEKFLLFSAVSLDTQAEISEPVDRHTVDKEVTRFRQDEIHSSSSSEDNLIEGSIKPKEEIIHQTECDQMYSSNFDASLDVDGHHDKGEKFSSTAVTYQHKPSNDVSPSREEELGYVVVAKVSEVHPLEANLKEEHKPTDEQPIDEHDKLKLFKLVISNLILATLIQEPSLIATETRESNIVNNDVNTHEVHDSDDKLSSNLSSMALEFASSLSKSSEPMLPTHREGLKDEETVSGQEDEFKGIDEGILPELDTVGDFNVKEIGLSEGSHVAYTESALLPEYIKTETGVKLPVLEARSVEDIDLAFKQLDEGVDIEEVILPSMIENQQDHADINSKLPVVEVKSVEDIDLAFKQLDEGVDVEEVILPSMIENQQDHADINSKLPVVEVRSVEDIDLAFKQLDEGVDVEEVILPSMIENQQVHADIDSKLPVVEVRSVEDIDLAFKQLDEGVAVEEVILPSMIENQQVHADIDSKLPVVEVRSVEDIDLAFKQLDEGVDVEEVILPSMIENQQVHADIDSKLPVVEVRSVEDIDLAFKQLDEGVDVEEVILPSMIENQQVHADIDSKLPVVEVRSVEDIDLAFKQLDEGVDVEEVILPSMIENQQDHADIDSKLPVVEVRSVEDIDLAFKQLDEGVDVEEVILPSMIENQQDHADIDSKLAVVEVRSVEDIDLAFKQLDEGVDVEEVILPSMIENQQVHADIDSKLPVVEVRSVEDIDLAFKQLDEGVDVEEVILPSMIENQKDHADIDSKLPVVKVRSVEDIDLAFKQLDEGVDVEEVILPSMIENQKDHADIDSKLPVVEVRSVEDIDLAFKQLDEGVDVEEVILPSMIENQKDHADINSKLPVVEVRSVEDIDLAFMQLDEGIDVEEVILPSMIENQQDHAGINSKLPVVEARSVEDIHNALQQGRESNLAELPHSSDLRIHQK